MRCPIADFPKETISIFVPGPLDVCSEQVSLYDFRSGEGRTLVMTLQSCVHHALIMFSIRARLRIRLDKQHT